MHVQTSEVHSPGFRAEAVELVISSQKSLVEVAASLGINEGILGNWVRAYRTEHPEAEVEERGPEFLTFYAEHASSCTEGGLGIARGSMRDLAAAGKEVLSCNQTGT